MIIKSIKAKNYRLFRELELTFSKTNLITGINYDTIPDDNGIYSGNASAKTSIIEIIVFGLYGEITGSTLKDLTKIGTKDTEIVVEFTHQSTDFRIVRKIPNYLDVFVNGNELKFNTASLSQKYLNELYESDFQHFRTYHFVDNERGINLLNLGIISLRKSLMDFANEQFISIRQSLLSKKLERENFNVNKKLYHFYLSAKREAILNDGLNKLQEELKATKIDYDEQLQLITNLRSDMISRQKILAYKVDETRKAQDGLCPILKQTCDRIGTKLTAKDKSHLAEEINSLNQEVNEIVNILNPEEESMRYYKELYEFTQKDIERVKSNIMKIKEAQKFSDYKYTKEDVQLYADSVKILDSFASYYIQDWLSSLAIILNDLLKDLNISIEFSIEKDFIKINNNGQELNYSQLSGGQKKFLGTVFKIGILLQEGINSGVLIFDEGLGEMEKVNFYKLIEILKRLSFQCFIIYQNCPEDIKDVNYIKLERKNNESRLI
jgi:hypothetical protein